MVKKGCVLAVMLLLLLTVQTAAAQPLREGEYTVCVTLTGGSGRAQVKSPTQLRVTEGEITATVIWSSPYYDFMLVDDVKYLPINSEGNSVFEIPIVLDTDIAVGAQTSAMSVPHLIEYTLHFDSATTKPLKGKTGYIVYLPVVILLMSAGAVLLYKKLKSGSKQQRVDHI